MVYGISQGFILIGYSVFIISRFRKNKKNILITDNLSRICSIIGYILLKSVNSIEHTLYGIIRNIVGQKLMNCQRNAKLAGFTIMMILLVVMYGAAFTGISTIMFCLSGLINLFAVIFLHEQGIRMGTVLAAICNIIAFSVIHSYASIIGEAICGSMGLVSFIKELHNSNNI